MCCSHSPGPTSVVGGHVEIGLDEDSGGCRGGLGRRDRNPDSTRHHQQHTNRAQNHPVPVPDMRARLQHQPACQERIDAHQHKADSVDAGPGGELIHQRVIHLRVAELVPGDGGDARGGQLQRAQRNGAKANASRVLPVARRTSTTPKPKRPK